MIELERPSHCPTVRHGVVRVRPGRSLGGNRLGCSAKVSSFDLTSLSAPAGRCLLACCHGGPATAATPASGRLRYMISRNYDIAYDIMCRDSELSMIS